MPEPTIDSAQLLELDALLRAKSVAGAARALGRSEKVLRAALEKLRETLRDRLLVGAGPGARLTPRARALVAPVAEAVARLRSMAGLGSDASADADADENEAPVLRVAATDYLQWLALPLLARARVRERRAIALSVVPVAEPRLFRALATGEVDLALGLFGGLSREEIARAGLVRKKLFVDRFVCVLRRGNGRARALDLDSYTRIEHVAVAASGGATRGVVDEALAERGRKRVVGVTVPTLATALEVVAASDGVLTLPERATRGRVKGSGVVVMEAPVELPAMGVYGLWSATGERRGDARWAAGVLAE